MPHFSNLKTSRAWLRGVFFLLASAFLYSCENNEQTPDWQPSKSSEQAVHPKTKFTRVPSTGSSTRFVSYNLRNYLSMPRGSDRSSLLFKPDSEISDLIANILRSKPDVLGVCEIGTSADLADLQKRLRSAGCDLPYTHLTGGADAYRRLAILSKYPLTAKAANTLTFRSNGKQHKMLRGILDCSISLPTGEVRFVGIHLKSKRPSKYWDQARIRRDEASLVRQHISHILQQQPQSHLLVYGDFNDSKQSPAVRSIVGKQNAIDYMKPLNLKADDGSKWTHYWAREDIYARLDYVFASAAVLQRIDNSHSEILRIPAGDTASDHRPLIVTIR